MKRFKKIKNDSFEAVQYTRETLGDVVMFFSRKTDTPPVFKIYDSDLTMEVQEEGEPKSKAYVVNYRDFVFVDNLGVIQVMSESAFRSLHVEDVEPSNPVPVEPETPPKKGA